MPLFWTIAVGGTEKKLADWGVLEDISSVRCNNDKSTLTLTTTERFDPGATQWSGPQIVASVPVHTHAIVYRDRSSGTGNPNSFSGGSIYFQGYFDDPKRVAHEGREYVEYHLHNVVWLMERNAFKQFYYQSTGVSATVTRVSSAYVANGGNGYRLGDQITLAGGTGTFATFFVIALTNIIAGAGQVVLVAAANGGGQYTANPTTLNGAGTTGGSGTGLTLNITMGPAPTLLKVVMSEVYLGESLNFGYVSHWDSGLQCGEILDWMNTTYNPTRHPGGVLDTTQDILQKGTIDPKTFLPITRQNITMCLEALKATLREDSDSVIVEDPTTTPPTISIRKLGKWNLATNPPTFIDYTNLPLVSLTITAEQEADITAQSQLSKVLPGVICYYKYIGETNGVPTGALYVDKADSNGGALYDSFGNKLAGAGSPIITDYTPEVMAQTFNLAGASVETVQANITSVPMAQSSWTNAQWATWWQQHDKSLSDPSVTGLVVNIATVTVVDGTGAPVNTALFQYELTKPLPDWMIALGAQVVQATVSAKLTYSRNHSDPNNNYPSVPQVASTDVWHTQKVQLTTVAPNFYQALSSFTTADTIPIGVAESAYRSAACQQWAGSVTFIEQNLRQDINGGYVGGALGPCNVGCRLQLIGPNTTFNNLLVQEVREQPHKGKTTIVFGPAPPVDVDQWVTLALAARVRWHWALPSGRGDGRVSGQGAGIDQGATAPTDNTTHGQGGLNTILATSTWSA